MLKEVSIYALKPRRRKFKGFGNTNFQSKASSF
jgi:4-hydroxyphenylpyruvate dioxygenase-like putative hemolysin